MKNSIVIALLLTLCACSAQRQQNSSLAVTNAPPARAQERIADLETQVAALRKDLDTLVEPVQNLALADASLVNAANEIKTREINNKTIAKAPTKAKARKKTSTIKTYTAKAHGTKVIAARIGNHAHKTRLVLDLDGAVKYTKEIDANEGLVTISLPANIKWSAKKEARLSRNKYIAGYTTIKNANSLDLIVELKGGATLKSTEAIRAHNGKPYRIAFDFAGK